MWNKYSLESFVDWAPAEIMRKKKGNNVSFHDDCFEDKHFLYILLLLHFIWFIICLHEKENKIRLYTQDLTAQPSGSANTFHAAAFSPCVCDTSRSHASIIAAALLISSGKIRWSRVWASSQQSSSNGSNPLGPWLGEGFCLQRFSEIRMCHHMLKGNVSKVGCCAMIQSLGEPVMPAESTRAKGWSTCRKKTETKRKLRPCPAFYAMGIVKPSTWASGKSFCFVHGQRPGHVSVFAAII